MSEQKMLIVALLSKHFNYRAYCKWKPVQNTVKLQPDKKEKTVQNLLYNEGTGTYIEKYFNLAWRDKKLALKA